MPSILCRLGRKRAIRQIIKNKAPKDFTTYVEAFVGSGDVYFYLDLDPSVKAYINDLDPLIAQSHKIIKSNPSIENIEKYDLNLTEQNAFVKQKHTSPLDKLASNIMMLCGTFSGKARGKIYQSGNIPNKLKKIPDLAEYMKNTTITQQDWKTIFKKHDKPNSFIYLDPPYEKSEEQKLYKINIIDFEEMARLMKSAKASVMLSINDSPNIRDIFKGLKISKILVKGKHGKDISSEDRKELIITNY